MDAASNLQQRIDELAVTVAELESLSPGARVYQKKTSTPIYFLSSKADAMREKSGELERLKSGRRVPTKSSARYILYGPRVSSWDFRTNLGRDVFWYISQANSSGIVHRASSRYWGVIVRSVEKAAFGDRYPSTVSCIQIPAVPVSCSIAQNAGRWESQLLRMSAEAVASGTTIRAERIAHTSIDIPQSNHTGKAILYFHGGAYVVGSLEAYRDLHMHLSSSTKLPIYSVEYRLAPQFKYPVQLYDAFCAYTYLRQGLGYEARNIVVAGDSAGGNLALALWQLVRPHNEPIAALILLSPRVDISYTRDTWRTNSDIDYLEPERLDDPESSIYKLLGPRDFAIIESKGTASYMKELANDPFIAPINADLSELPPTLIQASRLETMYSDICEFAARATASVQRRGKDTKYDGPVKLQVFPDGVHVFHVVTPHMRGMDVFWGNIGSFIQSLG
ncbi:hypothetical protein EV179_004911 [Coemansia sp. RSA 487]|nr:hypothetical protein LPJ74_001483 [Coemansia sp. RSA 1843]KAJ2091116.1 hypothetical protein IW138_002078 [Coemansia sp. RSA 986]KAJ2212114.1 hypothetical protein EV179_004911 [Coemansia sp. RSA 487]